MESKSLPDGVSPSRGGPRPHAPHLGGEVRVGQYQVLATGTQYKHDNDFGVRFDDSEVVLVPLTDDLPGLFGSEYRVLWLPLKDFGGVPDNWEAVLTGTVIPRLEAGQTLLAFCAGSHGRTGTFLASLIALLETAEETPDPIAAARQRHCIKSVETLEQAEAIFALRGQAVPQQYALEFAQRRIKTYKSVGSTATVAATKK